MLLSVCLCQRLCCASLPALALGPAADSTPSPPHPPPLLPAVLAPQVTALDTRVLQLQADAEVAAVTAGLEAQAAAEHVLQQAQAALKAVERVSEGCT